MEREKRYSRASRNSTLVRTRTLRTSSEDAKSCVFSCRRLHHHISTVKDQTLYDSNMIYMTSLMNGCPTNLVLLVLICSSFQKFLCDVLVKSVSRCDTQTGRGNRIAKDACCKENCLVRLPRLREVQPMMRSFSCKLSISGDQFSELSVSTLAPFSINFLTMDSIPYAAAI